MIEQAGKFQIVGIIDFIDKLHQLVLGHSVIGCDEDLPDLPKSCPNVLITLGQIKSPVRRMSLFNNLLQLGAQFPVIQSPLAYISPHAQVADGTIVMHHALINAGARVGRNCIINNKALVEHDAIIEDHCHISTGTIVNGGTTIGCGSFVGSNSVSPEYASTPSNSFIKANTLFGRKT